LETENSGLKIRKPGLNSSLETEQRSKAAGLKP